MSWLINAGNVVLLGRLELHSVLLWWSRLLTSLTCLIKCKQRTRWQPFTFILEHSLLYPDKSTLWIYFLEFLSIFLSRNKREGMQSFLLLHRQSGMIELKSGMIELKSGMNEFKSGMIGLKSWMIEPKSGMQWLLIANL